MVLVWFKTCQRQVIFFAICFFLLVNKLKSSDYTCFINHLRNKLSLPLKLTMSFRDPTKFREDKFLWRYMKDMARNVPTMTPRKTWLMKRGIVL